jgi:hypothetical protein
MRANCGPHKTTYNRFNLWSGGQAASASSEGPARVAQDSTHVKAHRGASEEAIGVTKGGGNSKIHALVNTRCRPRALMFTSGNIAHCTGVPVG